MFPYGTGNDFARVTNWGRMLNLAFYRDLETLIREVCSNSEEKAINVWDVEMKFRANGDLYYVDY